LMTFRPAGPSDDIPSAKDDSNTVGFQYCS
jgi:hypothetical protein